MDAKTILSRSFFATKDRKDTETGKENPFLCALRASVVKGLMIGICLTQSRQGAKKRHSFCSSLRGLRVLGVKSNLLLHSRLFAFIRG